MWRDPLDELIERLDNGLSSRLPGGAGHSLPRFAELQWAVSRILDGIEPPGRLAEDPRFRMVMDQVTASIREPRTSTSTSYPWSTAARKP